jgi:hypothetical protein
MSARGQSLVWVAVITLLSGGCATTAEWAMWRGHPTHFASGDQLSFSVRNPESSPPRVTRHDLTAARQEGWWGDPVTVSQNQILER